MADETFDTFVTRERARLQGERQAIFSQQQELEAKLEEVRRELAAIDAYEAAKTGKSLPGMERGSRGGGRSRSGGRRGSKREQLLEVIRNNPSGMSRGEILEKMGLKGDKSGEMSVSNALTALTKGRQVLRQDGKYRIG